MKRDLTILSSVRHIKHIGIGFALLTVLLLLLLGISSEVRSEQPERMLSLAYLPSPVVTILPTVGITRTAVPTPPPAATPPSNQEVAQGNFGSWNYRAVRMNGQQIVAGINFDSSSVATLNAYATSNRAQATELATRGGEVNVHITFRTYVAPAQFRSWATAIGLRVERSDIRLVQNGKDAVIGIGGTESDPLSQASLDEVLQLLIDDGANISTVRGVYFTIGTINASQLPLLAADPLVYLPDVTINVVRNELIAAQVPGAEQADIGINFPVTPFWKMEHDFGLENFTQ